MRQAIINKLSNKRFWLSNLKSLAIMITLIASITYYQQRNMVSGPAPALSAQLINGDTFTLMAQNNTLPTLVYFWGSWCSVCKTTSPSVSTLALENAPPATSQDDQPSYNQTSNQRYNIVSVALSSGSDEEISHFLDQQGYSFNTINDHSGQISQAWGVAVTPSIFILDPNGNISATSTGMTSLWGMRLRLWLSSL